MSLTSLAVIPSSQEPTHLVRAPLSQDPTYHNHATGRSLQFACTCINEAYPCYATHQGTLSCWSVDESFCSSLSGEYCTRAECTVSHCSDCSVDGASCRTCEDGYVGAACEAEATFFADVSVQLLRGGVVGMASPKLHALLSAGFDGTGNRAAAVLRVAQAFTRKYADSFELVVVLPAEALPGDTSHQEYFGATGAYGTSTLQGVICGGNPLEGGFKAILHEITHNFVRPQEVVPYDYFTRGSHWGFTGTGTYKGMLGGYPSSAISCVSPAGRIPTSALPCATNDSVVDATAGSPSTSNDLANTDFASVELYMMGLLSEAELINAAEEISTCTVPPGEEAARTIYDNSASKYTVSCDGGVQFLSPAEQAANWAPTGKELAQGQQLRIGIVLLFSDVQSMPASAANFSASVDWATDYFENILPPLFAAASRNLATVSFAVDAAEAKRPTPTPPLPPPPPPPVLSPLIPPPPETPGDGSSGVAVAGAVAGGFVALMALLALGTLAVLVWQFLRKQMAHPRDANLGVQLDSKQSLPLPPTIEEF